MVNQNSYYWFVRYIKCFHENILDKSYYKITILILQVLQRKAGKHIIAIRRMPFSQTIAFILHPHPFPLGTSRHHGHPSLTRLRIEATRRAQYVTLQHHMGRHVVLVFVVDGKGKDVDAVDGAEVDAHVWVEVAADVCDHVVEDDEVFVVVGFVGGDGGGEGRGLGGILCN